MNIGKLVAHITANTTDLVKGLNKSQRLIRQASGRIKSSLATVKNSVFSLQNAFMVMAGGVGVGFLAKSFVGAASKAEGFRVRLNTLLGSVEEGARAFKEMSKFAGEVPYKYEEIMQSATALSGVMSGGVDQIKEWMPMITDLAAVSGISLQETTGQIIRMYSAGAASADMFRERGILAMMGFKAGVSYTAEETRKMMFESWNAMDSKFKGVTANLARTWEGMMSMLGDAWFQFRTEVMEAGVFDFMKAGVGLLLDSIKETKEKGDMGSWAKEMADKTVDAFELIIKGVYLVGDAHRGWKMIVLGLELAWTSLVGVVLAGQELLAAANLKFAETFQGEEAIGWAKKAYDDIIDKQDKWLEGAVATEQALADLSNEESGLVKANRLITAIRENQAKMAEEAEAAAKKLAAAKELAEAGAEGVGGPSAYDALEIEKTEILRRELEARGDAWEAFNNELTADELKVFEDKMKIHEDFDQQYKALTMSRFNLARQQLEEEIKVWEDAHVEKEKITAMSSTRSIAITQAETEARLSFYQGMAGGVGQIAMQIAQAGGKHSLKAFRFYQAMAITEAIIGANLAAAKVLGQTGIFGIPLSTMVWGMAMANVAMIAAAKPPSYDRGGVSTVPGVYYSGVPEAHIPLQGGAVPVALSGGGQGGVNIIMENPVFQDVETQRQALTQIAEVVVNRVAPGAVVKNYYDDGPIRQMVRGRQ